MLDTSALNASILIFDKSLPMGLSSSSANLEDLSCAVQWILQNQFNVIHMSHILDDFMFLANQILAIVNPT